MGCASSRPLPTTERGSNESITNNRASSVRDEFGFKENLSRITESIRALDERYILGNVLGEGITGQVRLCTSRSDGAVYAMKTLNVKEMDEAQLTELRVEIESLKSLDHPNIVSLKEVFETPTNICIITEHCAGGDLSDRRFNSEQELASVIYQITRAIAYCHHFGIIHRDLKMENIMFASKESDEVRIIDFGLSRRFLSKDEVIKGERMRDKARSMKTACGTAFYMSPEMLTGHYTEKSDIWAIGVITFMLITGKPPFPGKDAAAILKHVKLGKVSYDSKVWTQVSPEALQFTQSLLSLDPAQRPSAPEALRLKWLEQVKGKYLSTLQSEKLGKRVFECLVRFANYPMLKKAAFMVITHHAVPSELSELKNLFLALDTDQLGELTFDQMFVLAERYGPEPKVTREQFREIFNLLDQDRSGVIRLMEFLAAAVQIKVEVTDELILLAFEHLDSDSNGYITANNVKVLLGNDYSEADSERIVQEGFPHLDTSKKGITKEDFFELMKDEKDFSLVTYKSPSFMNLQEAIDSIKERNQSSGDDTEIVAEKTATGGETMESNGAAQRIPSNIEG